MADIKKESANEKIEKFIFKNRKAIIMVACAAVVAGAAVCIAVAVNDSMVKKGLASVDALEFEYKAKSTDISDEEISARQVKALSAIAPLCNKSGIVGVRANMLAADVYFAKKDYASALESYLAAAAKGKKSYTAPICMYNAAVCNEELGNREEAVKIFTEAAETKDFLLSAHAYFNAARIQESLGLIKEASENYSKVVEKFGNDPWARLSQSRLIELQANGLID